MYIAGSALLENPALDELTAAYESRYGVSPRSSGFAPAYNAANLLLDALDRVVVQGGDGTLHIGRQALRDTLYATSDFQGVTGVLTCDEFGDCGTGRFNIFRLDDTAAGVEGLRSNVIFTHSPE